MPTLLVVQHTPSPSVQEMLEAVLRGTRHPEVEGVSVDVRAALSAGPADVLAADGVILGTPANIGYMSGALKHFLDQVYYPCLEVTVGLPYGVYVHGNDDTSGALRAIHKIASGMQWRQVAADVSVEGAPSREDLASCEELGALLALQVVGY
jgi:multimeric flavodoxin WrbA